MMEILEFGLTTSVTDCAALILLLCERNLSDAVITNRKRTIAVGIINLQPAEV